MDNNKLKKTVSLDNITEKTEKAFDVERLPFRRNMTQEELRKLQKALSSAFSAKLHPEVIEKIMHYCYFVERHMKGRAAGNIEDMIIRYLLRYFASLLKTNDDNNLYHLEIGVLFGAATIFSCHATQLAEKDITTVVIDPFEGYYGQEVDVGTKLKVDEETFWSNLAYFDFQGDKIKVLKGLSTDINILNSCNELQFLSILIDGDHSYDGVKNDWINYSPLVVPWGYVLIDDYNNPDWPDVTAFVNKEILSNLAERWQVVLVYGHSILLQRTDVTKDIEYSEHLFHRIKDIERVIENQKHEINRKNNQIQMMLNSHSWKITAPLRKYSKPIMKYWKRQSKNVFNMAPHCERIRSFKDKYKGLRCFVIGNGPSLNKIDLRLLSDEYTFGVNGIFYKYDEVGFKPTFYMVEDNLVVKDNLERINGIDYSMKFFPHIYHDVIKQDSKTIFMPTDFSFYHINSPFYCQPRFSFECDKVIYTGQTVTYQNMQLAYYMGFETVYLIGMDFYYKVPPKQEMDGAVITSKEDDVSHFHKDYFGKGKKWHDPKLANCELAYEHAEKVYKENGREIYNATIGGKLEVFERVNFYDLFQTSKKK